MVLAATGPSSAAGATMKSASQSVSRSTGPGGPNGPNSGPSSSGSGPRGPAGPSNSQPRSSPAGNAGGAPGSTSRTSNGGLGQGGQGNSGYGGSYGGPGGPNGPNSSPSTGGGFKGSTTSSIGSAASSQRASAQSSGNMGYVGGPPNAAAARASAALNAGLGRSTAGALNTSQAIDVGGSVVRSPSGAALGSFRTATEPVVRNYTSSPVSPDTAYQMRFNPGTTANIDRIVGAKVVSQNPGVRWGANPDYGQIGNLYNQTISGEAAFKGPKAPLDQMSVANSIANRMRMASEGVGLPGNFPPNATYNQVMRGFDANNLRRTGTFVDNYNNQGLNRQISYGTTALGSLSPNAGLNQAKTNPAVAQDMAGYYGTTPQNVTNVANATHYYNAGVVTPSWADNLRDVGKFGSHRFGTADVSPQKVADLGYRAATMSSGGLLDSIQQTMAPQTDLFTKTNLEVSPPQTSVPSWYQGDYTGRPTNTATTVPSNRQSTYTGRPTTLPSNQQSTYTGPVAPVAPASTPIDGVMKDEAYSYPVKPYGKARQQSIDAAVGVLPVLGQINSGLGAVGYSAGNIFVDEENKLANMTPEQRERYRSYWSDKRANSPGRGDESRGSRYESTALQAYRNSSTAAKKPTSGNNGAGGAWEADAKTYGYSEAQLKDPETRGLIKQLWDMGFIPKATPS